jgi:expansin
VRRLALVLVPPLLLIACGSDDQSGGSTSSSSSGGSSSSSGGSSSSSGGGSSSGSIFSGEVKKGIATYYDADGSGNCSFDASPNDLDVVALNFPEYAKSAACGGCLNVKGPIGEVTVRVVDSCPGCNQGHLDLSEQAFVKVAEKKAGRVDITYQAVACNVSGNMSYHFKDGSSKFWTAIQIRNHRIPVTKVEYKKGGAFVEMKRADYNFFIDDKGVGDQPNGLTLRITGADTKSVEDTIGGTVPDNKTVPGSVQLP